MRELSLNELALVSGGKHDPNGASRGMPIGSTSLTGGGLAMGAHGVETMIKGGEHRVSDYARVGASGAFGTATGMASASMRGYGFLKSSGVSIITMGSVNGLFSQPAPRPPLASNASFGFTNGASSNKAGTDYQ